MSGRAHATAIGRPDTILPSPAVFAATFVVAAVAWTLAFLPWSSGNRPFAASAFAATSAGAVFGLLALGHRPPGPAGTTTTSVAPDACGRCGACTRACPMDVDVGTLAAAGGRIGPGECVLCQRCVQACPTGALRLTFGAAPPPHVVQPLPGGRP